MKNEEQLAQEIIKIMKASSQFFVGNAAGMNSDDTVNVRHPKGYSVNAIAGNAVRSGQVSVFQDNASGNWYAFTNNESTLDREDVAIFRRSKPSGEPEPRPINLQILYFTYSDGSGYFRWYVGGDRDELLLIYEELDKEAFPPTANNVERGIDYAQPELSNHSNLNKQNFRSIFNRLYDGGGVSGNIFPIISLGRFSFDSSNLDPGLWEWMPTERTMLRHRQRYEPGGTDYDYQIADRNPISKYSYVGNGYAFRAINLISRIFFRSTFENKFLNVPSVDPPVLYTRGDNNYVFDGYYDAPPGSLCNVEYIEPIIEQIPDSEEVVVTSRKVNVDVTFTKDKYEYTLPLSERSGAMPLKNPIVKYDGDLSSYTYEGEHYLHVGGKSYITEYIRKDSPTQTHREIRFYKNKRFVCKLNTNESFTFTHDSFNNNNTKINLEFHSEGSSATYITTSGLSLNTANKCLALAGKHLIAENISLSSGQRRLYRARCVVNSVTINNFGAAAFNVTFTTQPSVIDYSSNLIFFDNGSQRFATDGSLKLESGSYYDFVTLTTRTFFAQFPQGLSNDDPSALNQFANFHPFDPDNPNYLHEAIINNQINFQIYYQPDFYGLTLGSSQYSSMSPVISSEIFTHSSDYLGYYINTATKLYGNKLYHFRWDDSWNEEGGSGDNNCYIEEWEINESSGKVRRKDRVIKVPVKGMENWNRFISEIVDMDIGFNF